MKYLVLDFETTGLDPTEHEPTQVAALLLDDSLRELAAFATLIRPQRPETVTEEALAIQGRTLEDFIHAMEPPQAFGLLADYVGTLSEPPVVVGHNIGFDLDFLRACEDRLGLKVPRRMDFIDTVHVARVHLQARELTADARLETLTAYYGLPHEAHDALGDVRATAQVLSRFLAEAPELVERARSGTLFPLLLDEARKALPGNSFVASCEGQYQLKGYLSPKQIAALVRIAQGLPRPDAREVIERQPTQILET